MKMTVPILLNGFGEMRINDAELSQKKPSRPNTAYTSLKLVDKTLQLTVDFEGNTAHRRGPSSTSDQKIVDIFASIADGDITRDDLSFF